MRGSPATRPAPSLPGNRVGLVPYQYVLALEQVPVHARCGRRASASSTTPISLPRPTTPCCCRASPASTPRVYFRLNENLALRSSTSRTCSTRRYYRDRRRQQQHHAAARRACSGFPLPPISSCFAEWLRDTTTSRGLARVNRIDFRPRAEVPTRQDRLERRAETLRAEAARERTIEAGTAFPCGRPV